MNRSYAKHYEELYFKHWWWRAREQILVSELAKLSIDSASSILDVGCGNGVFFEKLSIHGEVWGIEVDRSLIPDDSPHIDRIYGDSIGHATYEELRFDLITALDVVEHLENDRDDVRALSHMLKPGGLLVVTVPAFMALWDKHDEINNHYRRYTTQSFREILPEELDLLELRYLFPSLFFPKLAAAWMNRLTSQQIDQTRVPHRLLNRLLARYLVAENRVVSKIRMPIGSSVFALLQKR